MKLGAFAGFLSYSQNTFINNSYSLATIQGSNIANSIAAIIGTIQGSSASEVLSIENVYTIPVLVPNNNYLIKVANSATNYTLNQVYFDNTTITGLLPSTGVSTGNAEGFSSSDLVTEIETNFDQSIWISDILRIEERICFEDSCGPGECLPSSGHCICSSNYVSNSEGSSCIVQSSCTPPNYSNSSNLIPSSVYVSQLDSSFSTGNWQIGFLFSQSENTMRDIQIFSSNGELCTSLRNNFNSTSEWFLVAWEQSISTNQNPSLCEDAIAASIPWSSISACLKDASDTNLYRGKVLTVTSFSNTEYYSNNFLKRVAQDTVFTSERLFSFNFDAQISTNTSDSSFSLRYGTQVGILVNMSAPGSASCLLSEFANTLQTNASIFLVLNDVDQIQSGLQNFDFLILENSFNSSESLSNELVEYLNNNSLSCENATTFLTNETVVSPSSFSFQMRVITSTFDSSNYQLILQVNLRTSTPLSSDNGSFNLNTSITHTTSFGTLFCDAEFCDQTITITYDLNGLNCSGVNEYQIMQLDVLCSNSAICSYYLSAINGKKIEIPFTISAEWCPKEESTTIGVGHFLLSSNGTQLNNGDALTTSRTIDAEILVNILTRVSGTSVTSSTITNLIMSDGITAHSVASNEYSYTATNTADNVTFEFSHQIDPAQIALNFSNSLTYLATIQVSFLPTSKKKSIGRANGKETISLKFQSSRFTVPTNTNGGNNNNGGNNKGGNNNNGGNTSSPSPSSSPSSSKTLPIVIAVVASITVVAIVALIVIIRRRSKVQKGNFARQKDDDIPL